MVSLMSSSFGVSCLSKERIVDAQHSCKEEMISIAFLFGMELKQLRVLQAVGETGSFSAADDRLDYTQPAVSKIVAALERQLGTTLVDRGIRPLRLTEAGNALAQRATAAFEQIAAAQLEVEAIANISAGSLRIGT